MCEIGKFQIFLYYGLFHDRIHAVDETAIWAAKRRGEADFHKQAMAASISIKKHQHTVCAAFLQAHYHASTLVPLPTTNHISLNYIKAFYVVAGREYPQVHQ